jgi:signal transduction histidine kinase
MRVLGSIRGRLLLSGAIFTVLAMVVAGLTVRPVLDHFVRRNLDSSLETQLTLLTRAVRPDGSLDAGRIDEVGPFARHGAGWAWSISGPAGGLRSQTPARLDPGPPKPGQPGPQADRGLPSRHADGDGKRRRRRSRSGETETFYFRTLAVETARGPVTITTGAPRYIRDRMRDQGLRPLMLSLAVLGVGLLLAMVAQLELGLRPLARLSASLAKVRSGDQSRISDPQPAELKAVVAELNALLDHNEAALAKARAHVSNLAHGLKTPLATLAVRLAEPGRDPDGDLASLVAQIDGAIGHHLGRARAASPGAPGRPPIAVGERLADLVAALSRIHAARGVRSAVEIPDDLQVTCDPQDFDEMVGNLLDNAWKWAGTAVQIAARRDGGLVVLTIDDDGSGLSEAAAANALIPGRRLDEQTQGHGFGLSIALELAELHDGGLVLGRSPLGGLRTALSLPGRAGGG